MKERIKHGKVYAKMIKMPKISFNRLMSFRFYDYIFNIFVIYNRITFKNVKT